jgi:hypothetical protein
MWRTVDAGLVCREELQSPLNPLDCEQVAGRYAEQLGVDQPRFEEEGAVSDSQLALDLQDLLHAG